MNSLIALDTPSQSQWIDRDHRSNFECSEMADTLGGGRTTSQGV